MKILLTTTLTIGLLIGSFVTFSRHHGEQGNRLAQYCPYNYMTQITIDDCDDMSNESGECKKGKTCESDLNKYYYTIDDEGDDARYMKCSRDTIFCVNTKPPPPQ